MADPTKDNVRSLTSDNFPRPNNAVEVIDLREYWQTIMRHKWRIASLAVAMTMLAAVIVMAMTPIYKSTSTLMIESQEAKVLSVEEIYGIDSANQEYFLTQFEILKSRQIAQRVVEHLDLYNHPEFLPKDKLVDINIRDYLTFLPQPALVSAERAEYERQQQIIDQFVSQTEISPIRKTQLVNISFYSESAELAAQVANSIAEMYINNHLEAKMEMTNKATTWLSERQNQLRETLAKAEARLAEFKEQNQLVDVQGVEGLASQELNQLNSQLSDARRRLGQAESVYSVVRANTDSNKLETLPEILNHSVIQDVKKLEADANRRVSELARRYGPKHPSMIAAQAELDSVRTTLRTQIDELVQGINNEYTTARADVASLERQLASAKNSFQAVSRQATRFDELQRQVDVNRNLYDAFLTRYTETTETSDFATANARITDPAVAPLLPAKPNKKLIVALALVVSTMIGIMLAFLYEALHDGIRTVEDVENKLSMRLLGLLPAVDVAKNARLQSHIYFDKKERAFPESVRSLRTAVTLSHIETPAKVITITSTMPGEGKSTVASNLAFAMGQSEKVLLIDGDLRKPSLSHIFGLPAYHPGLTNLIAGTSNASQCISHDDTSGIDVMPAGMVPPNPQELLLSQRFEKVLEVLAQKYDRIIIDTAPTQAVADALLLSRKSDAMIYVVKADDTSIKAIKQGIGRLLQVNARLDGVVLNYVDTSRAGGYGGYYYYGYGHEQTSNAKEVQPAA